MNINVTARIFAAIAKFTATRDIRYYLEGVYLEPHPEGGAYIIGTDGHTMGVWLDHTATGVERPIIIKTTTKLLQACQGSDMRRLTVLDGRLAVVLETDQLKPTSELYIDPIEIKTTDRIYFEIPGKFPDWRKVVPASTEQGLKGFVMPSYLNRVHEAVKIGSVNAGKFDAIQFMQADKDKGVLAVCSSEPNYFAVIMPMRHEHTKLPRWVQILIERERDADQTPKPEPETLFTTDPLYKSAVELMNRTKNPSTSFLQRHLNTGYVKAQSIMKLMTENGVIKSNDNGTYSMP